jgi:hypothetical protein
MTSRGIGRIAVIVLGLVGPLGGTAEAKNAAVSRAPVQTPPTAAICTPALSVDELAAYIADHLRIVDAQMERLALRIHGREPVPKAILIELQQRMSERETLVQLRENLLQLLLHPPEDVPDEDDSCTSTDSGM